MKAIKVFAIAAATATLTACTITPEQLEQLKRLDAAFHAAAPYIITVEPIKK